MAAKDHSAAESQPNRLECADLSALLVSGTGHAVAGDQSPGEKAATSRRTPGSSHDGTKLGDSITKSAKDIGLEAPLPLPLGKAEAPGTTGRKVFLCVLCTAIHSIRRAPRGLRSQPRPSWAGTVRGMKVKGRRRKAVRFIPLPFIPLTLGPSRERLEHSPTLVAALPLCVLLWPFQLPDSG